MTNYGSIRGTLGIRAMPQPAKSEPLLAQIQTHLNARRYEYAEAALFERLTQEPSSRENNLYLLLIEVSRDGAALHQNQLGRLRKLSHWNETEKEIVRRIFALTSNSTQKHGRKRRAQADRRRPKTVL